MVGKSEKGQKAVGKFIPLSIAFSLCGKNAKTNALKSILLAFSVLASANPGAIAQGLEAGSWQTMSPSGAIGPEQDSLLPPEVVPLDPATAGALSASQAQQRQVDMSDSAVPGLSQAAANPQDLRRQAFEQLYGGQTSVPPAVMNQVWRAGQQAQMPAQASMPQAAQMPQMPAMPQAPGMMQPNMIPPQAQAGGPNYQMANNQQVHQGYVAQSQTLTGGTPNQPQQVNTRRGGVSNVLNYASAFGAGALSSGFWSNNPWLGAGIFGMTMTGMGVRNNSRF